MLDSSLDKARRRFWSIDCRTVIPGPEVELAADPESTRTDAINLLRNAAESHA